MSLPSPLFRTLAVAVLISAGCATSSPFTSHGFRSKDAAYEIPYVDPSRRALLPDGWTVANYRYTQDGPAEELTEGRYESKLDWEFSNGERRPIETTTYELLLEHTSNAAIWVRLLPVPRKARMKEVRVIAENYANNLSGSVYTDYLDSVVGERRISTKLLSSIPTTLLGHPAHAVTFEVVNLDQLEHDPDAPRTKVEIMIVAAPYHKTASGVSGGVLPAYLLFGYANDALEFDARVEEFRAFVKSVRAKTGE